MKNMQFCWLLLAALLVANAHSASIPDEDWGYVEVRTDANLFWWLYGSNNTQTSLPRGQQPLVLWLQGGPGASSIAYGNFQEMGPLDVDLKPRNSTWVQAANVLYLDQPVGTGWSYVGPNGTYTTTNAEIAADVLTLMKAFLAVYPDFQTAPFFIFSESYGGKMTSTIATVLLDSVAKGALKLNFRGVALGDSWINGIDYVTTWGPLLQSLSEMTQHELQTLTTLAVTPCANAVAAGNWTEATNLWSLTEGLISGFSCVNFYNSLQVDCGLGDVLADSDRFPPSVMKNAPVGMEYNALRRLYARHVLRDPTASVSLNASFPQDYNCTECIQAGGTYCLDQNRCWAGKDAGCLFQCQGCVPYYPSDCPNTTQQPSQPTVASHVLRDPIDDLMNGPIRAKLNSGPKGHIMPDFFNFGSQSSKVFATLSGDFMKPVLEDSDSLLSGGKINVTVYEGQLDLICATVGAELWMSRLKWPDLPNFLASPKKSYSAQKGRTDLFRQSYKTLSLWYVMMAGHMVPTDNPAGALLLLQTILREQSGL